MLITWGMYMTSSTTNNAARKLRRCERCGKYKRALYNINGMNICRDCIRGIAFYQVFKEGFRDPKLRGDVITIGLDIGNLVYYNPHSHAWCSPLVVWIFCKEINIPFYYDSLKKAWRYKVPLDKVMKLYIEEGVFRIEKSETGKEVIVEGEVLKDMLKRYGDRNDVFDIIGAWVTGLIISRLHEEPDAPDFRSIEAIIDALSKETVDSDGNIIAEPYYKVTSYVCRICGGRFPSRDEVRKHLMQVHTTPSDEIMTYVQEESVTIGYLLELSSLVDCLKRNGVSPERLIEKIEKFAILIHDDAEAPRIIEREGKRYIVVDPAWVRVTSRTRIYERELVRGRSLV
jgi:ribosomal protein S14